MKSQRLAHAGNVAQQDILSSHLAQSGRYESRPTTLASRVVWQPRGRRALSELTVASTGSGTGADWCLRASHADVYVQGCAILSGPSSAWSASSVAPLRIARAWLAVEQLPPLRRPPRQSFRSAERRSVRAATRTRALPLRSPRLRSVGTRAARRCVAPPSSKWWRQPANQLPAQVGARVRTLFRGRVERQAMPGALHKCSPKEKPIGLMLRSDWRRQPANGVQVRALIFPWLGRVSQRKRMSAFDPERTFVPIGANRVDQSPESGGARFSDEPSGSCASEDACGAKMSNGLSRCDSDGEAQLPAAAKAAKSNAAAASR
jgi:hypothetical protein